MDTQEMRRRRAAAGHTTANARAAFRDAKLMAAMERLLFMGQQPGQREVATAAGVSLRTVQKNGGPLYKAALKALNRTPHPE